EEGVGVPEAPHPPQEGAGRVLEGDVVPRHDPRYARHGTEQTRPDLRGLEVGDAHALDAADRDELRQQLLEQIEVPEVLAVGRGVLSHEEELAHPLRGEPAPFGHDVGWSSGDEGTPKGRDRAEGATAIAAGGDLQRRPRPVVETGPG